jgi:hypothetical protein
VEIDVREQVALWFLSGILNMSEIKWTENGVRSRDGFSVGMGCLGAEEAGAGQSLLRVGGR